VNLRTLVPKIVVLAVTSGLLASGPATLAAASVCGQPVSTGVTPTATDSLYILRVAVGAGQCAPCVCDVDGSSAIQATDALLSLKRAVGQDVAMLCPPCVTSTVAPVTTTSTPAVTTTSTLSTPTTTIVAPGCGNGVLGSDEQCDDGNRVSGDGCSADCVLEDGRGLCAGVPSVPGTAVAAELLVSGLTRPVGIEAAPLDTTRLFILEQRGAIRIVKDGVLLASPFLDIDALVDSASGNERGLLGLAFHPDYASNRRFFVNYTDNSGNTVIARYETLVGDPEHADPASAKVLLTVSQPFSNHNGGQLAFGPDGYLYAGLGDGGSANDPDERAQDDSTLLGKMLRIDVDVEQAPYYALPAGNPHPERGLPLGLAWAKGLRNPWRFSFDRATGDLYIGDVGQSTYEEIDVQPAGSTDERNYGWDHFEGVHCLPNPDPQPPCPATTDGFTMPVHEYDHSQGCSITGGYVYRGCALPDLQGTYGARSARCLGDRSHLDVRRGRTRRALHRRLERRDLQDRPGWKLSKRREST